MKTHIATLPALPPPRLPERMEPRRHRRRALPGSRRPRRMLMIGGLMGLALSVAGLAQYAVDWFTVDNGGGTSTGGGYSLSGTVGQPDAGAPMTGGPYSLTGGFWGVHAIQTPGAPWLTIVPAGPGQVTISWTPDTPGWMLQQNPDLAPATWTDSPSGSTNPVTVPIDAARKFYRLTKP